MSKILLSAFVLAVAATSFAQAAETGPAEKWLPPEVTIHETPAGPSFADLKGMTLYVFDRDREPNKSNCVGPCATAWPPVTSAAKTEPQGDWSLVTRPDGARQWAYRGRPLYRYAMEIKVGMAYGDGGGAWHLALTAWEFPSGAQNRRTAAAVPPLKLPPSPGGITAQRTAQGGVFADSRGMTLYWSDNDRAERSTCTETCLQRWRPLNAPMAAQPVAEWTIVKRDDGSRQWAFKGRPLYLCSGDSKPGERACASERGPWHPADL